MVLSLLEAMVATWAISFLSFVDFDSRFSSSTTFSTACSMPAGAHGFAPPSRSSGPAVDGSASTVAWWSRPRPGLTSWSTP